MTDTTQSIFGRTLRETSTTIATEPEPETEDGYHSDAESLISNITLPSDYAEDTPPPSPRPSRQNDDNVIQNVALTTEETVNDMFLNPDFADIKVICGDRVFPAHKMILCPQSDFFAACFQGPFRESHEGVVTITDEKPKTIYRLLHFLYKKDYLDVPSAGAAGCDLSYCTKVNFTMYHLAYKFGIPELAKRAAVKQRYLLRSNGIIETDIWSADLAYRCFKGRHDAMRMIHVAILGCEFEGINGEDMEKKHPELKKLCEKYPELCWDLMVYRDWEQRFPDEDRGNGDEYPSWERPYEWVRNKRGGYDIEFQWGPARPMDVGVAWGVYEGAFKEYWKYS
ncbi:hypothetical protein BJ508DRAFT_373276 [Ascobolus immersus RN42]|uniref:BTB domain-containing protein n=1 Tax=Ascobolus immersus RN42 TaxID=1160509 RepID=A0A3N4IHP2_ASCIM|nr:hypothetical protein BJ508DRAFT_373276 [Ascobolus immersus RN42]